jgi:hypothetical protein
LFGRDDHDVEVAPFGDGDVERFAGFVLRASVSEYSPVVGFIEKTCVNGLI